jgi:hypothetical protein
MVKPRSSRRIRSAPKLRIGAIRKDRSPTKQPARPSAGETSKTTVPGMTPRGRVDRMTFSARSATPRSCASCDNAGMLQSRGWQASACCAGLRDHEFNLVHQELERFDGIVDSPERSRKFKAIRTESSIRSEGAPSMNHADMFFLDPNWANRGEQPWFLIFRATPAMSQGRNHRCQRRLARSRRRMEIFRWQ